MFEHITYIIGAYATGTVILAWCAVAPVIKTRAVRARLLRAYSRASDQGAR